MSKEHFLEELDDLLKRYCYYNSEYQNIHEQLTIKRPKQGNFVSEVRVSVTAYLSGREV